MARKKITRTQADIREHPSYSIDEVAAYIGVPKRTLRRWISGYSYMTAHGKTVIAPIIPPADPRNNLLSFFNLAEAQVLAATRERNLSTRKIRRAVEYMRDELNQPRPLLTSVFETDGQDIFVQKLTDKNLRHPLNVSRHGQYGFKAILKKYLSRIEHDASGHPTRIFPLRVGQKAREKNIVIHPFVSSGKPSLRGSGVMAEVIWRRNKDGESIPELARDFRLKPREIKAAITYFAA